MTRIPEKISETDGMQIKFKYPAEFMVFPGIIV